jgi:hypothetical protein
VAGIDWFCKEDDAMIVNQDTDGSLLGAASPSRRAIVFLTVEWSVPERRARAGFWDAAEQLAATHPNLGIAFFSLMEDAEWCQQWLAALKVPQLGTGYPLGAGSMLWLEIGRPVAYEVGGAGLGAADIVARTRRLWSITNQVTSG